MTTSTTSGLRLEPQDEYPHEPDDAANFNESVYASCWDRNERVGGWMRLGNRVNEGYAELSVCLYLPDGRVACQFKRPEISTNDAFEAGGIRYEVSEPFSALTMTYEGELLVLDDPEALRDPRTMFDTAQRVPGSVDFAIRGVSPMHGGEPTSPESHDLMYYGHEFSRGHFNQHTAVTGALQIGGERFELDGFGWRDHSWGPRYWQAIWAYRLFIANFGEDRALMILKNMFADGTSRRLGLLLVDGEYEEVTDLDVQTTWSDKQDPDAARLGVRTANRAVVIDTRTITLAPLRNRRKLDGQTVVSRVAEAYSQYTWDGREGYGIMEYIEILDDGRPVGFPL